MFKIESYITPYILAYLDKYFKNFNPANFQVSLWSGGASFNNLDLNLEVLEEEFNLPVTFVSGHIHELRLFVPWTKITYEPIVVNVNTIEITLKIKKSQNSEDNGNTGGCKATKTPQVQSKSSKVPEEPPGYVQNLINKMITNLRIDCQNVIVKLVEEDIVFTLNVKTASLYACDGQWKAAFIDLVPPDFTLRRHLAFSDLTICLDKTNSAGKIEQYLEPILYRCSFDIRIFQQFFGQFATRPFFTRMDVHSEEMKFTITDEQIPMLLKLYNMIIALKNTIAPTLPPVDSVTSVVDKSHMIDCEALCQEEDDPVMSWAGWAVGWIPDIPATIFGAVDAEDDEGFDGMNIPDTTSHLGFYVNRASILFKGMEAVTEQKNARGAPRVKFQSFLRCAIQGIICDVVTRAGDTCVFTGVSQILVEGVQTCPCGMKDCEASESPCNEYLRIGEINRDFANNCLFEGCYEAKPPHENVFTYDGRVEIFTEEMMLERSPAVAVDYLDLNGERNEKSVVGDDDTRSHHSSSSSHDGYDLGRDKQLCRLVVAPCTLKICSGSIHRLKMILFSASQSEDTTAASSDNFGSARVHVNKKLTFVEPSGGGGMVDFSGIRNIDSAFNVYQFTIFRPYIEIVSGDHLDFDQQTHLRAKYKKRKATSITPLSEVLPEWPKIIVTFSCIDGRITDPNFRFRKLMNRAAHNNVIPPHVLDLFSHKISAKVFGAEAKLRSDKFVVPFCIPFNLEFSFSSSERPDKMPNDLRPVSQLDVILDDFRVNLAKPHLMLMQVILTSCYDERFSEHLTSTTILRDLPLYNQGDVVIHITEFSIQAVFTRVLHTVRTRVGSLGVFIHNPSYPAPIPIFEGPPNSRPDPEGLAVFILQYPLHLLDDSRSSRPRDDQKNNNGTNDLTPVIVVNISEFLVQFEPIFFQWLSYHPRQMPSSIPVDMQGSESQVVYPMIPVSRTSSRMSVMSKAHSSWSTSDENNAIGSVTGKDFQQLYQSPKEAEDNQSINSDSESYHQPELIIPPESRPRRKSTLEQEFQMQFALFNYVETWNKWIVTHLAIIMKSFIIANIGQGDVWFPVGQQSFISFSEKERRANGILVHTPEVVALPEGPRVQTNYSQVPLPLTLPDEYAGRELYPLRITAENFALHTVHVKDGKQPFSLPISILLTLTLTEKKPEGGRKGPGVIAAFLHSDIPAVKLSLSFIQINLLLRLMEQFLQTTAMILKHSASLMLRPLDSNADLSTDSRNNVKDPNTEPVLPDMTANSKRRLDPTSIASSTSGFNTHINKGITKESALSFARQHSNPQALETASSLLETEPQITESFSTSSQQGLRSERSGKQVRQQTDTKTSVWVQVTLAQFQLIIINARSGFMDGDATTSKNVEQLVFELEDMVSSLDVQQVFVKWALKLGSISLRRYERSSQDRWDVGTCVGIIMSSGEDITKDVTVLKGSRKRQQSFSLSASGSASPIHGPSMMKPKSSNTSVPPHNGGPISSSSAKPPRGGVLTFTFTQVQTKNFHKKSEMYSPVNRWNAALGKWRENHHKTTGNYHLYDEEEKRYLSEFDIKFGSLDFLVDLASIHPFVRILNALGSIEYPAIVGGNAPSRIMPVYSNTTLPLVYLETGNLRIFLKTTLAPQARIDTPDMLVFQVSSLTVHSQSENPLARTIVNKELHRLAEHTNILTVPGSPVEDRQYQVDIVDVLMYTCHWKNLKANSRELLPRPTSTTILKTMGENPALEWNTLRSDSATEDDEDLQVIGHPLIERLDMGIAFAPAVVYEANLNEPNTFVVVAGNSLEFNATNDVYIYANLHQIACLQGISTDLSQVLNDCALGEIVESKEDIVAFSFFNVPNKESGQGADSGIDSIITVTTTDPAVLFPPLPQVKSSEMLEVVKETPGGFNQVVQPDSFETVPFDLLVTGSLFQIMTYDLKYKHMSVGSKAYSKGRKKSEDKNAEAKNSRDEGKIKSSIVALVPLAFCVFGQPHFVLSVSDATQKAELSIFELFIGFAPAEKRTVHQFALPDLNDYPDRLFECTPGERDPKTGMVPAFFGAKFTDFKSRPCDFHCDLARPLKISLSRRIIKNWLRIQRYFDTIKWKMSKDNTVGGNGGVQDLKETCGNPKIDMEETSSGLTWLTNIALGRISISQVVFSVTEEVEEDLPRSSAAASFSSMNIVLKSRVKNRPVPMTQKGNGDTQTIYNGPDNLYVDVKVSSLTLSSGIGARRDIIMTPWDLKLKSRIRWKPWRSYPNVTASINADPMSLHIGPQNILAFLQLHETFGNYLMDFIAHQEEKIEKIMKVAPGEETIPAEDYQDDLRSGNFRYVHCESADDLPDVYQIAFCEAHRTMTWRYPHKRTLTRMESIPVPIDSDLVPSFKNKELPCIIEYFDDAQNKFCHFGVIYLSESSRGSMRIPEKDKHLYVSNIWRVVLEAPLNETDSFNLVKPDILAASLRVDSLQDASLNPRLKLYFDIPKISIHFVNQLTYAGKYPRNLLKSYSFGGLTLPDQPFASLELSTNSVLLSLWLLKCKVDLNSFFKLNVMEYNYLTEIPMVEPFTFQVMFHLNQKSASEANKTNVKLQMSTKPVTVRLSSSILHTLTASFCTWIQVLSTYDGQVVDFSNFQSKNAILLTEILVCNDLHADILVNQIKSEESRASVNSETFQSIGCRECFSFAWPSHKATSTCRISVRDPDWKASDIISLYPNNVNQSKGMKILNIAKSSHRLFVDTSNVSSCQIMITIYGSFTVLNALDEVIEIALLPKFGGREVTWPIQSRNHGPSRLIEATNIEHFRFRFIISEMETLPWSPVVTIAEIKAENSRCLPVEMYKQGPGDKLITYSVWVSIVEEVIEGFTRSMVVISPFFRAKSSLPISTKVFNSVGRGGGNPEDMFELQGEGAEQKIDFIGNHKVVHHLTFQSSPKVSLSSPPIPLVPGGPLTEKFVTNTRPIKDIMLDIVNSVEPENSDPCSPDEVEGKENRWPYIREDVVIREWAKSIQPDTTVEVGFTPWIEGLPTVLIDVKPWALFVNLTDKEISFAESEFTDKIFTIDPCSVFTPSKISGAFRLGFESGNDVCWAEPLEFTEQKSRTEIHNANNNNKIPVDCFTRLEIRGRKEVCYLTLETRFRRDILVLTLRPTFTIQNKTDAWVLVKGISLQQNISQGSSEWTDIENFGVLPPEFRAKAVMQLPGQEQKPVGNNINTSALFTPLLIHSAKDLDVELEEDEIVPMKYLALSCGGPWWFVHLLKFDLTFQHMSAREGLLGKRLAFALPKHSPVTWENQQRGINKLSPIEDSSLPVVLSWTAKNGQVWISVSLDTHPQLTILNLTSRSLFCAQPSAIPNIPICETENFDQYTFIPSYTRCYYNFPGAYSAFPEVALLNESPTSASANNSSASHNFSGGFLPYLMLANLPEKPRNIPLTIRDSFGYFQEKNLIFSGVFEWSKPIRVDGPPQSVQIVDVFGIKVTVEQVGLRRNVYIENLSSVEVSAKDIRYRISDYRIGDIPSSAAVTAKNWGRDKEKEGDRTLLSLELEKEPINDDSKTRSVGVMTDQEMMYLPAEFTVFVPWLRVVILDNISRQGIQQEVLSACCQDLLLERFSQIKHIKLRSLGNEDMENWILRLCLGDAEINTPPLCDRKANDFAVVFRQDSDYVPINVLHEGLDFFSSDSIPLNLPPRKVLLSITATYGMTSANMEKELLKVDVNLDPVEVFVERHLVDEVIPIVIQVFAVLGDRSQDLSAFFSIPLVEKFLAEDYNNNCGINGDETLPAAPQSRQSIWKLQNIISKGDLQDLDNSLPQTSRRCLYKKRSQIITLQDDLEEIDKEIKENRKLSEFRESKIKMVRLSIDTDKSSGSGSKDQSRKSIDHEKGAKTSVEKTLPPRSKSKDLKVNSAKSSASVARESVEDSSKGMEPAETAASQISVVASEPPENTPTLHIQSMFIRSSQEVENILQEFAEPLRLQQLRISPLKVYGTVRFKYGMYLAFDRAPVDIQEFVRNWFVTTHFGMGHILGQHYWQSLVYGYKNMVTGVGSWEGVGSPTRLVGEVGTGLRDLVVYPYQGIFKGPAGFFMGIGKGCSSMVKHIAAGTLSSVTNGAWTWSRNLDALTQDDEDRRADVHGVADGITQGFASLGVRMLGAVGGIAHYPIQSIIQGGSSPKNIAAGVAKGMVSVVTKPVGGALELLAMTGEGILKGTGWIHDHKSRFKPVFEEIQNANNAPLKFYTKIIREEHEQRVLLIVDASQPEPSNTALHPMTLVITTENLYVFNSTLDELTLQFPICKLIVAPSQDRNLLCLRIVNQKKPDDFSVAEERVIEFVRGFASAHALVGTNAEDIPRSSNNANAAAGNSNTSNAGVDGVLKVPGVASSASTSNHLLTQSRNDFGNFFVDENSKIEFINVLNWAKKNFNADFYRSNY